MIIILLKMKGFVKGFLLGILLKKKVLKVLEFILEKSINIIDKIKKMGIESS